MNVGIAGLLEQRSNDRRTLQDGATSSRLQQSHDVAEVAVMIEREIRMILGETPG